MSESQLCFCSFVVSATVVQEEEVTPVQSHFWGTAPRKEECKAQLHWMAYMVLTWKETAFSPTDWEILSRYRLVNAFVLYNYWPITSTSPWQLMGSVTVNDKAQLLYLNLVVFLCELKKTPNHQTKHQTTKHFLDLKSLIWCIECPWRLTLQEFSLERYTGSIPQHTPFFLFF